MRVPTLLIFLFCCCHAFSQEPRLVIPSGHSDVITDLQFSPDNKKVATVSFDGTVKVWDARTGKLLLDFRANASVIRNVSFSPDGQQLATTGGNAARIFLLRSGKLVATLQHEGDVRHVKFSPDGKHIATATTDGKAKLWSAPDHRLVSEFDHGSSIVDIVSLSPDSRWLLTGTANTFAYVWSLETGEMVMKMQEHFGAINAASFSPDGKRLLTAGADNKLRVWDFTNGELLYTVKHADDINSAAFSPSGKRILTTSEDSTAKIWDTETGDPVKTLRGHSAYIHNGLFSADEKQVITTGADSTLRVWEIATGDCIDVIKKNARYRTLTLSPDGQYIAAGFDDYTASVWQLSDRMKPPLVLASHSDEIVAGAFSNDNSQMVVATSTNVMKIWDMVTGRIFRNLVGHTGRVNSLVYINEQHIVSASNDSTVRLWSSETGELKWIFRADAMVDVVNITPDKKHIVIALSSGYLYLIDPASGKGKLLLERYGTKITSIDFSSDSKKIVTGSYDNKAEVWSIEDGEQILALEADSCLFCKTIISAVTFSKDGKRIYAGGGNGKLRTWDALSGKLLATADMEDGISNIILTSDGKQIFVATNGYTAFLLNDRDLSIVHKIEPRTAGFFGPPDWAAGRIPFYSNSEMRFLDLVTGKKLYSFIHLDSLDYFVQLPDKYYLSSPSASRLLHYVTADQTLISFEQLDVKYNRPDRVLTALGNTDTTLIRSFANAYEKRIQRLKIDTTSFTKGFSFPVVTITNREKLDYEQRSDKISLSIQAKDTLSGIDRFHVWVNESPLFAMEGVKLNVKTNRFDTVISIPLSAGRNYIETSVTNVNGIEGYRASMEVEYKPKSPVAEKVHFIGIGINEFAEPGHDLQWSVRDIEELAKTLKGKFPGLVVDTLFNRNVTIENVAALKNKLLTTGVNDKVIISFSGHGLFNDNYAYFLSTYRMNFDKPEAGGLPYQDLEDLVSGIPARQKLILIDACLSGEIDQEEMKRIARLENGMDSFTRSSRRPVAVDAKLGMKNGFELMQQLFVNVGRNTGATIISAASGTQLAQERSTLQNGVFTYAILEFLNQKKTATVSELNRYVSRRVSELTNGIQVPTTRAESKVVDWKVW